MKPKLKYRLADLIAIAWLVTAFSCTFASAEYAEYLENPYTFHSNLSVDASTIPEGSIVGIIQELLVVAGGLQESDNSPIKTVRFRDLENSGSGWQTASFELPMALAFGGTAAYKDGLILAGGISDSGKPSNKVCFISRPAGNDSFIISKLLDLPEPRSHMGAVVQGDVLYLAGGLRGGPAGSPVNELWKLNLASSNPEVWQTGNSWPGEPHQSPMLTSQFTGDGEGVYLLGGKMADGSPSSSVFEYEINSGQWTVGKEAPQPLGPAGVVSVGAGHIFAFPQSQNQASQLPFLAYHTITNTWVETTPSGMEGLPLHLFPLGDSVVSLVENTEESVAVFRGELPVFVQHMHIVDYSMLAVYFAFLVWMGFYFSKQEKTTNDFFRGGKRIPGWAAGLSILGTRFSAISFMGYPAKTFATNLMYFMNQFGYMLTAHFVVKYIISFFVRLDVTTAYEYLEKRFGAVVRTIGSVKFVLFDLFRMGALVLLPSMVLTVITGINIYACIVIIGVISTAYTFMGGIEAVIWTDVVQLGVMLGGTILAIGLALWGADGNIVQIFQSASAQGKTEMLDFSFDLKIMTFWVFLLALPGAPNESVSAQYVVQRFISAKDFKNAAQSMYINSFVGPAVIFIFFILGTAIFMFYQANPAELNASMRQPDEVMAWFIVQQLPIGISGLMIAAIFAATMSSLDSALSSTSTVFITDIYRPLKKNLSDREALRTAKRLTVLIGVIGTSSALILAAIEVRSLLDYFLQILYLLGGGLAGIFYLGIFTKRANTPGTVLGYVASASVLVYCKWYTDLSFFAFNGIGVVVCIIVGYLSSFAFAHHGRNLDGLTVHTLEKS